MSYSFTDEAIVLRTYNVGETDRFCVLLTQANGKIAARGQGVRRLTSKRGGGLLPFHRSFVTLEHHSFGHVVTAATCIDSHSAAWKDPRAFGSAARGIELVLRCTEEGVELPELYNLVISFLSACTPGHSDLLVSVFTCRLLSIFGLFPSVTHSALGDRLLAPSITVFHPDRGSFGVPTDSMGGLTVSPPTLALLQDIDSLSLASLPVVSASTAFEFEQITQGVLGSQLGASLVSPPVSLALSSTLTPICQ